MKTLVFILALLIAFIGCGADIFDTCSYDVGDVVDFVPSQTRDFAKFLSLDNKCGEKISIELITFEQFSKNRKVKIRIVEVKSKYSYIGIRQ